MPNRPPPLLAGTLLAGRFRLEETLGQGEFGITYRAADTQRGDLCVVRELAPAGAIRDESGLLLISRIGEMSAQLLRHRFQLEAKRFMRVAGPGLPLVRQGFIELGTAFYAREYVPSAQTLAERIEKEGRLDTALVTSILETLASALQRLHTMGALHLDVRPSNVLLTPRGSPLLIDPGEARKWHRDLFRLVENDPFASNEIAGRGARLTPQADVFGLAATLYTALAGFPPTPSKPELGERPLPLDQCRSDVPRDFSAAIERALSPLPHERQRNVISFADEAMSRKTVRDPEDWVAEFDRKALELKSLRFNARECPSCKGVLETPKPLRPGICPVCHEGSLRHRKIVENVCPNCRMAYLKRVLNVEPLSVCPLCSEGFLHRRRKRMLSKEFVYGCDNCEVVFEWKPPMLVVFSPPPGSSIPVGEALFAAEWREKSGRADEIWHCSGCGAQYDLLPDRRWRQMVPSRTGLYDVLEPWEWFRVAAGLPPEAGNAECDACGADFYLDGQDVALLGTRFDPHHFAQRNANRLLSLEEVRWLGVGKHSPNPGFVCSECDSELDFQGDKLNLVRTGHPLLIERIGQTESLENWHRAARGLPLRGEETAFEQEFANALQSGYMYGTVPFSAKDKHLVWKGKAVRLEPSQEGWAPAAEGQLEITTEEFRMGGMIKKWRLSMADVKNVEANDRRMTIETDGGEVAFELEPVDVTAALESGPRAFKLGPSDLAFRLRLMTVQPEPAGA